MNINNVLNFLNGAIAKINISSSNDFFKIIDKIVVLSPNILKEEPLKKIFDDSTSGIILIANSLILFYSCYYIFSRIISMYNGNVSENIFHFVIKLVIIILVVNNSYFICEQILELNRVFCDSISDYSEKVIDEAPCFENLNKKIQDLDQIVKNDNLSFEGIIKSMISFSSLSLIIAFSTRYVTIIFLIIISPIAIVTSFSNITRGICKMWGKLLFINLIIEAFVKLVIIIPLLYKKTDDLYIIILLGSIYVILKINSFAKEILSQICLPYSK